MPATKQNEPPTFVFRVSQGLVPATTYSDGKYELTVDLKASTVTEFAERLRSMAADAGSTCKLTRLFRTIPSYVAAKAHTIPCSFVFSDDGMTLRRLADVFTAFEESLRQREHDRREFGQMTFSEHGSDGIKYQIKIPLMSAFGYLNAFERLLEKVASTPESVCTVTKPADKSRGERARWVKIPGPKLLAPDGTRRPINDVFDEFCRGPAPVKSVYQPPTAPWRLCLGLEEPPASAEDGNWTLRVFLQAADDPTLRVELDAAKRYIVHFRADERTFVHEDSVFNGRRAFDIERYGKTLGEAAVRFPILAKIVGANWRLGKRPGDEVPSYLPLTQPEVVEFLSRTAPELEAAGFGILLPAHLDGKRQPRRLSVVGRVTGAGPAKPSGLRLDGVMQFDWQLALGDDVLTAEELAAIVQHKLPLVRVRGRWAFFSADEMRQMAELVQAGLAQLQPARELLRLATCGETVAGLPVSGVTASGIAADLWETLYGRRDVPEEPVPTGLATTLRPYQCRGYSWLTYMAGMGLGACLADDMGLGKTVQALACLLRRWESGHNRPNLLICPTSVIGNWQMEAAKFAPGFPVRKHHGDTRATQVAEFFESVRGHGLVITSYSLLSRDIELFRTVPWGAVILDEAQNIKNPETNQARAAKRLAAECRFALTGTPVENSVRDLWSVMDFLNPGYFGTWPQYERRYYDPIHKNRDPAVAARLQRAVRPFLLRRVKTDRSVIADLPDKMEAKVFCTLTREQATLYETVLKDGESDIGGKDGRNRRGVVLALLGKLKQVCNHPRQFMKDGRPNLDGSGKLTRLTEMVEEVLQSGERALVFTQYREMGDILQRHLSAVLGEGVLFLHGGVAQEDRTAMVERYQAGGSGAKVFVLSLKAGGTGLTLTAANHVFHYDQWWNPAVEDQATDRAYRIGQTRDVQVHKLICVGTLEERIGRLIDDKRDVAGRVVGNGEDQLCDLSDAELHEFLRLGEDAIAE